MAGRREIVRFVLSAGLLSAVAACAAVVGIDELRIGDCKGGICEDDGGEPEPEPVPEPEPEPEPDGGVEPFDGGPCVTGEAGPTAVRVGTEANSFCIDSTEVTNQQYRTFLEAGVDANTQPPQCNWNRTFAPATDASVGDLPVTGVDWCDALAYCKWAGKYLCGRSENGEKTGPVSEAEIGDEATNQWLLACSGQTNRYPYGSTHDVAACNVAELDAGRPLPVGSLAGCEGSYPGVFDMVGNVWEWFDGPCRTDAGLGLADAGPAADECWLKGGGYPNRGANIDCKVDGLGSRRDRRSAFIGIRCCSN